LKQNFDRLEENEDVAFTALAFYPTLLFVGSLSSLFLWGLERLQQIPASLWALPFVAFLLHKVAGFDFAKKGSIAIWKK